MGGNGSYSKAFQGVPDANRTHIDTHMRINGHKVLLQSANVAQSKNIMQSHSPNPIYIIGRVRGDDTIVAHSVLAFQHHAIALEINLIYDTAGNYIPFQHDTDSGSHAHRWHLSPNGEYRRERHQGSNVYDIPREYDTLIGKIIEFNQQKHRWP